MTSYYVMRCYAARCLFSYMVLLIKKLVIQDKGSLVSKGYSLASRAFRRFTTFLIKKDFKNAT